MADPGFIAFFWSRREAVFHAMGQHFQMAGAALGLALVVGVAAGIAASRSRALSLPLVTVANIVQTIPSLALLGFLIPLLGIGMVPAVVALFAYSVLPILKNTHAGILQVEPSVIEAGRAMGMTSGQILWRIELPLALPVAFSGLRIAAVSCIGIATLCAAVGAGGLGTFIFRGISMVDARMILAGAVPAAVLAVGLDFAMHAVEGRLSPWKDEKA